MDLGPICMPAKEHGTSSVVYAFALFVVCNSSVPCQTSLCDADGGDHVKIIQRGGMLDDFEMEVPGERTLSGLWPTSIGSECRGGGGGACLHEVRGGNAFQPGRLVAGRELVDLAINDDELRRHLVHGSSFPQGHAWPRAPGSMDRWVTPRVQRAEAQLLEELIAWVSSDECYGLFSIDRTQRVQVHFDMRADPRQGDTRTRIRGQAREYLQAALDQLQDKDMLLVVLGRRPFREAYITKVLSQSDHRPQYATAVLDVLKFENGPSDDDADTFAVSFSPSHSLGAASPKFVCDFSSPRPLSTPNSTHRNSLHAQTDGSRVSRPDPGPSIVPGSRSSPRVRQTVAQPGSPVALPDALPRGLCVSNVPPVGHNMVDEPWSFVPFSDPLPQESGATLSSPPTGRDHQKAAVVSSSAASATAPLELSGDLLRNLDPESRLTSAAAAATATVSHVQPAREQAATSPTLPGTRTAEVLQRAKDLMNASWQQERPIVSVSCRTAPNPPLPTLSWWMGVAVTGICLRPTPKLLAKLGHATADCFCRRPDHAINMATEGTRSAVPCKHNLLKLLSHHGRTPLRPTRRTEN